MAKIVGTGAVRVFPVMTGFKKTVKNEMAGSGREGAKGFADSLKGAGTKAGKQLGKELGTTAKDAMKNVGGDQVKQLSKDVASASAAVSKARIKQQTTTAAAIQAENAYANAVKQHGADSAQAAAASQRLAAARERVKLADVELAAATGNLKSARKPSPPFRRTRKHKPKRSPSRTRACSRDSRWDSGIWMQARTTPPGWPERSAASPARSAVRSPAG